MNPFEKTLTDIDEFCSKEKIQYSIIGGIALISYKIQRTTNDIDINLLLNLEDIEKTGEKIIILFNPIFTDPIRFFQSNFVLPVFHPVTKIRIDFAAGLTEFDKQVIARSERRKFGNLILPICSIEDLIIYKLFAGRKKDILDLEEISKIHNKNLDRNYLALVLKQFNELNRHDMSRNFEEIFGE